MCTMKSGAVITFPRVISSGIDLIFNGYSTGGSIGMLKRPSIGACSLASCRIRAESLARALNSRIWPCSWAERDTVDEAEEYFDTSPIEDSGQLECSVVTAEGRAQLCDFLQKHVIGDDPTDVFYDVDEHVSDDNQSTVDMILSNKGEISSSNDDFNISCGVESKKHVLENMVDNSNESERCENYCICMSEVKDVPSCFSDLQYDLTKQCKTAEESNPSSSHEFQKLSEITNGVAESKTVKIPHNIFENSKIDFYPLQNFTNIDIRTKEEFDISTQNNLTSNTDTKGIHCHRNKLASDSTYNEYRLNSNESLTMGKDINSLTIGKEHTTTPVAINLELSDNLKGEHPFPIENEPPMKYENESDKKNLLKNEAQSSSVSEELQLQTQYSRCTNEIQTLNQTIKLNSSEIIEDSQCNEHFLDHSESDASNIQNAILENAVTSINITEHCENTENQAELPTETGNIKIPIFTECRLMISRSTSLKTGKTPPGTPSRKKIVRFADVLGLDLEDVHHIISGDLPNIPPSAYHDLVLLPDTLQSSQSSKCDVELCSRPPGTLENIHFPNALYPKFAMPGKQPDFWDRVRSCSICLENLVITEFNIQCTCRVMNWGFHKKVFARYTTNGWSTSNDINASYVNGSTKNDTDSFAFNIFLSPSGNHQIELALCYEVNSKAYWDNNDGQNYILSCCDSSTNSNSIPISSTWMHQFW